MLPAAMSARARSSVAVAVAAISLLGCAGAPLLPHTLDTPPLALVPADKAGVADKRARFREIYCAVLEAAGRDLPDHRPCADALTRVGAEPAGSGRAVDLGPSRRRLVAAVVPGIGYDCVAPWLGAPGTVAEHVRRFGYDAVPVKVDALSGTATNARRIRDAVMSMDAPGGAPRVVLIGYSKGTPDVLDAVVRYPELLGRVAAVVSVAGAVGGSPLANAAEQYQAELMRHFPGATCDAGDGGAVDALRPATRQRWLAEHALPAGTRYYSLVTFPTPGRISAILKGSYDKLARVDGRNDGQVLFYDQVVPGSTLLGYIDADHWAVALPIGRRHDALAAAFVTQNAYPREALAEAILRFVEEDLGPAR